MSNKNYLYAIGKKIGFLGKHFRFFEFLVFIAYLFYLSTIIIDVSSSVNYVPSGEEVNKKFLPITAKKEIIYSIEIFFSAKQENLDKNLSKPVEHNPFMPYETNMPNPAGIIGSSENNVIN